MSRSVGKRDGGARDKRPGGDEACAICGKPESAMECP